MASWQRQMEVGTAAPSSAGSVASSGVAWLQKVPEMLTSAGFMRRRDPHFRLLPSRAGGSVGASGGGEGSAGGHSWAKHGSNVGVKLCLQQRLPQEGLLLILHFLSSALGCGSWRRAGAVECQ